MDINVTTSDSCKVIIEDTGEYLDESVTTISKGKFKYSETLSIDVLQLNKTSETVYDDPVFTTHDTTDPIELEVGFDGWFTVVHIVIPTSEWFETYKDTAVGLYDIVYYSDGVNIYKYVGGTTSTVDIEELIEVNDSSTTIQSATKDYVSICYLRKCYINYCQQIFSDRALSTCLNSSDIDSDLIYKRDLVWMAINVIEYLTECEQLAEVERIIESIAGCNGLCSSTNQTSSVSGCGCCNYYTTKSTTSGCGCSKSS